MIKIPNNILENLYIRNFDEAIKLSKEYISNNENDYLGWYLLFVSENNYYFDLSTNKINNEMAFNKALSLASDDLKKEIENEYNLFKAISIIPNASNLLRVILDDSKYYECAGMYNILLNTKIESMPSNLKIDELYKMLNKVFIIDKQVKWNVEEYIYLLIKYIAKELNNKKFDELAIEYVKSSNDKMLLFTLNNDLDYLNSLFNDETNISDCITEIRQVIDNKLQYFYKYAYNASKILYEKYNTSPDILAMCYYNGYGVEKDISKAEELAKKAISLNDKTYYAYFLLALRSKETNSKNFFDKLLEATSKELSPNAAIVLYEVINTFIKNTDNSKMIEWAKEEAFNAIYKTKDIKNRITYYLIAWFLENGYGTEKNIDEAIKYYYKSANLGYPDSYYRLYILTNNESYLKHAITLGSKDAVIQTAFKYYDEDKYDLALPYLLKGAAYKNAHCYYYLFRMYNDALGVEADFKKAKSCLDNAAALDNHYLPIAAYYYRNLATIQDYEISAYYYYRAGKVGYYDCIGKLVIFMFNNTKFFGKDYDFLFKLAKSAIKTNNPSCLVAYAYLMLFGYGIKSSKDNSKEAFELLKRAEASINVNESDIKPVLVKLYYGLSFAYLVGIDGKFDKALAKKYKKMAGNVYE